MTRTWWIIFFIFIIFCIFIALRLGYKTANLDENIIINRYAELYISQMENQNISASRTQCFAKPSQEAWIRLRIYCEGPQTIVYEIGLWGQLLRQKEIEYEEKI